VQEKPQRPSWWRRPNAEWSIVILTSVLTVVSVLQWKVTRDAMESSGRAYVGLKQALIWKTDEKIPGKATLVEGFPKLTDAPVLVAEIINSGATPALKFTGWASIEVLETAVSTDMKRPANLGQLVDGSSVTGSNLTLHKDTLRVFTGAIKLTPEQLDAIRSNKQFLTMYGVVQYTDVFGTEHTSRFCSQYSPRTDSMSACIGNNGMT
jgi:hypothetical protein